MWHSHIHLECETGNSAKCLAVTQDFFCYFHRIGYQERTESSVLQIKTLRCYRSETSFLPDLREHLCIPRIVISNRLFFGFCHISQRMQANFPVFRIMPGFFPCFFIQINQWTKTVCFTSDNRNHER